MPSALATISQKISSLGINAFRFCRDGIYRQNSKPKPKRLPASKKSKKYVPSDFDKIVAPRKLSEMFLLGL